MTDADPATRWSSPVDDDAWVQVELPGQATIGRVDLDWQDAYASRYVVQTSTDGLTWQTAATVTDGAPGPRTVRFDSPVAARFVRVQGVERGTKYGYSLFSVRVYAVADGS